MRRALRLEGGRLVPIIALALLALAVSLFILHNQRLRLPLIDEKPFTLRAELVDAKAVTPGQGQTVRVSGVRIGDITGVELEDGHAVATMEVDRRYRRLVHTDATILVRPRSGLDDMFFELDPGSRAKPIVPAGFTIPVRNTLPYVNTDEILSSLDADTRAYLDLLVNGTGEGLRGRANDLREVFRRFGPTHRDLARFASAVATRRRNLARLTHSLRDLDDELAARGPQLTQLVGASAAVFRSLASEDRNVSRTVAGLPGALAQTTVTLDKVRRYAGVLGPAAERLRPVARQLDPANHSLRPFFHEAAPILHTRIRPFVRDARPLVRDLRPAAGDLSAATPDLRRSFVVLNGLFNMLAYNPRGREGPDVAGRQEGFLHWLAWLDHNSINLFSSADAHGPIRPVSLNGDCDAFRTLVAAQPQAEFLLNLTPVLTSKQACGLSGGLLPPLKLAARAKAKRKQK